jgi:putative phosphoribosyl transferase
VVFKTRQQAAKKLATAIGQLGFSDLALFALPRGGVVIGAEASQQLHAPLGIILVAKIGHPMNPEYAIGAIAEDEEPFYNLQEVTSADPRWLNRSIGVARALMARRRALYSGRNVITPLAKNHTAVLIDDGLATGLTATAAVKSLRDWGAGKIVVATPVASPEAAYDISAIADQVVILEPPQDFKGAISAHYQQFEQVNNKEVKRLLAESFIKLSL